VARAAAVKARRRIVSSIHSWAEHPMGVAGGPDGQQISLVN
jgi:hypothetical protein